MTRFNPYEPPQASLDPKAAAPLLGPVLATRGERLAAAIIETVIQLAVLVPFQMAFHAWDGFPNARFSAGQKLVWGVANFALYLVLNGYFIFKSAQTVGKKVLRLQIVNVADSAPTRGATIILARTLPVTLAAHVPVAGTWLAILDAIVIFGSSRRCVHDFIAGTKVVKLPANAD